MLRGFGGVFFPGVAEAADGGVYGYLQALGVGRGQAAAVGEDQLGVAEDAGERVVNFVAEDGGDAARAEPGVTFSAYDVVRTLSSVYDSGRRLGPGLCR